MAFCGWSCNQGATLKIVIATSSRSSLLSVWMDDAEFDFAQGLGLDNIVPMTGQNPPIVRVGDAPEQTGVGIERFGRIATEPAGKMASCK